jgi:hypothetical protein
MAWVYRKYAKDHSLYLLQQDAKVAGRGLCSEPSPMPPWEWRQSVRHGTIQLLRYARSFGQYITLADKLVLLADKQELSECGRIFAINLAHYKIKYGELPQDDGMYMVDQVEISDQQRELIVQGMETLVEVWVASFRG